MNAGISLNSSLRHRQGIAGTPAVQQIIPYPAAPIGYGSETSPQQFPGHIALDISLSMRLGVSNCNINCPLPLGADPTESLAHFEALIASPAREMLRTLITQYFAAVGYAMGQDHEAFP